MNKQIIFVLFVACLASTYSLTNEVEGKLGCVQRANFVQTRLFEGKILAALENLRTYLKNGDVTTGLPPLDPLNVQNEHYEADNPFINLKTDLTAKSEGITGFKVTNLHLSLFMKLNFAITFPLITGNGDYNINTTSPFLPEALYGNGHFDTRIREFTIKGQGKISTKYVHGKVVPQISSLELDLSLAEFYLKATGLMNDEVLSKDISEILSSDLPSLLQSHKKFINEQIAKSLPYINKLIIGFSSTYGVDPIRC